jgi:hypothetical protein
MITALACVAAIAAIALLSRGVRAPQIVTAPHWTPLELRAGEQVAEYIGDYGALVESEGRTLVVQSSLPMRATAEDGQLAPVDLALEDAGSAFLARNPLIETRVSKRIDEGVLFERAGFRFALTGADAAAEATLVGGRAFYANAAR